MEYTINQLVKISGVTGRTLRYYDEIGLLVPYRKTEAGYRVYSSHQVDLLQQILIYKQLDMPLNEIKKIIYSDEADKLSAMENHLNNLYHDRENLENIIKCVEKTIGSMKGEYTMTNDEKFMALKEKAVLDNEKKYGKEVRRKYGEKVTDDANKKLLSMTEEQWHNVEELNKKLNKTLKLAVEIGKPESETAQYACELHKQWLGYYWNFYSKEAHLNLCEMYTQDERFKEYYEKIAPGCAGFLLEAMKIYLK